MTTQIQTYAGNNIKTAVFDRALQLAGPESQYQIKPATPESNQQPQTKQLR